jgi:hypothetical protein
LEPLASAAWPELGIDVGEFVRYVAARFESGKRRGLRQKSIQPNGFDRD